MIGMRDEKEIRQRLEMELKDFVIDSRETIMVAELVKRIRVNLLRWVLEEE